MQQTIIQKLKLKLNDNVFYIKRDDLFPVALGGNKARIALEFIDDMDKQGCDCLIGYGSLKSNMTRSLGLVAAENNIPFHIVVPEELDSYGVSGNSIINDISEAKIHFCKKTEVAQTIQQLIDYLKSCGFRPYYVNYGEQGKGNEKVSIRAYKKVYSEIKTQLNNAGVNLDYIFVPSGTGMTQSGLIVGRKELSGEERIVGISIARTKERQISEIRKFCDCKFNPIAEENIIVEDRFLCGGYGKYTSRIERVIEDTLRNESICLDPTYTGKCFYGMLEYIKTNHIKNKSILFLHTGGTPLYFDYLKTRKAKNLFKIEKCCDLDQLINFLKEQDLSLPTPLSSRVNIEEYANKVLKYGNVLVAKNDDYIMAVAIFYANDMTSRLGYLSLLITKKEFRGLGCASALLKKMEKESLSSGMKYIKLQTDKCNNRAISLYSSHGYRVTGLTNKVQMEKELTL